MACISWSRIWATRRTTTTSRKLPRCSSKILRWKRMYLLLRADQRLKQNHKDVLLPAHPHKLYLLEKELGQILNHKIIRPPLTQCQNNWVLFFVMVIYLEKMRTTRKGFNAVLILQEKFLYLRALQGHSGRSLIDPSLQDNVLIPDDFFEYIYHVGCAISLHSITNSGLISGGQILSKRQTVFFTSVDPVKKKTQRSEQYWLGSSASRSVHADNVGETSKHGVLGRYQTCSKERI